MYRLIRNARIATMDARNPFAQAAVVNGERFAFVGSNEDAASFLAGRAERFDAVDMQGKLLLPGFNDSHMHFLHYVKNRYLSLDLSGCASFAEMMRTMRSACEKRSFKDGEWLICPMRTTLETAASACIRRRSWTPWWPGPMSAAFQSRSTP